MHDVGDPFSHDPFAGSTSTDPFGGDPFSDAFKGSMTEPSAFAVDLPPKVSIESSWVKWLIVSCWRWLEFCPVYDVVRDQRVGSSEH